MEMKSCNRLTKWSAVPLTYSTKVFNWVFWCVHVHASLCLSAGPSVGPSIVASLRLSAGVFFFRTAEIEWKQHTITQDVDPWLQKTCKQTANSLQCTYKQSTTSNLQSNLTNFFLQFYLHPFLQTPLGLNKLFFVRFFLKEARPLT